MKYIFVTSINYFDLTNIESILKKNQIDFYIKSPFSSSVLAGWSNPAYSFNEKMLFVNELKIDKVKKILEKYIKDHND